MSSQQYVVFLRGVNVGGYATVKMDVLKKAMTAHKFENVKTYINSGNIVFGSIKNKEDVYNEIKNIIAENFGITVELIVKTSEELQSILRNDPYNPKTEDDYSRRGVAMLSVNADVSKVATLKENKGITENYYIKGDVLYIYYDFGMGKSKFTNSFIEKKLGLISTVRNWNTMLKMEDMMGNG